MTARTARPFSPQGLAEALKRLQSADRLVIAVSGGADSAALLAAAAQLSHRYQIRAVHVNHGFAASALLSEAATLAASRWGIALQTIAVTVADIETLGVEAAARVARYTALESVLEAGEDLLTAHHSEDQAETLLLQLLRGAGVRGLAAMPAVAPLGGGRLLRPLLTQSRGALRAFAEESGTPWRDDPSNADLALDRNYLRQVVWPRLIDRWPAAADTVTRSAQHLSDTLTLLDSELEPRLAEVQTAAGLSLEKLRALDPVWRREVVRAWLRQCGLMAPATRHLAQFDAQFLDSSDDANPQLALDGFDLCRHGGDLVVRAHLPPLQLPENAYLPPFGCIDLPGLGRLRVTLEGSGGLRPPTGAGYRLTPRRGGERWLPSAGLRRALKDSLREARIPPWVRTRAVLLWEGDVLAAVLVPGNLWIASGFEAGPSEPGLAVTWDDAPTALIAPKSH